MRALFFEDIIDTEKFSGRVWGLGDSCMSIRKVEESPYGNEIFQRTLSADSWENGKIKKIYKKRRPAGVYTFNSA